MFILANRLQIYLVGCQRDRNISLKGCQTDCNINFLHYLYIAQVHYLGKWIKFVIDRI